MFILLHSNFSMKLPLLLSNTTCVPYYSTVISQWNFVVTLCFCQIELTIKQNPSSTVYNSTLAQILVEYAAAVSSFAFFPPYFFLNIQLLLKPYPQNSYRIIHSYLGFCLFSCFGVKHYDILQIYTADLTQLFTWTCARCGDLIKVNLHNYSCNFGMDGWWNLIGWPRGSRW